MTTILFGSISTLADTSEIQREAFNEAFAEHGLDWRWDRDEYRGLLRTAGGAKRIAQYAADRGEQVDADAVHTTKSERFRARLADGSVSARPGVMETIVAARERGDKVALVTTTAPENVAALTSALGLDGLDLTVDATSVDRPKPDPAAYTYALQTLGVDAGDAVAIEDNEDGLRAAKAAGLHGVAFPNENTADHEFAGADGRVTRLTLEDLDRAGAHA